MGEAAMRNKYVFCCIALMAFVSLAFPRTGHVAAEIPSSEAAAPFPGQPISKATTTVGDMNQAPVLTLGQCIDTALKNNPTIRASMYGVDVSRSRVGEARSGYYPQLSASAA